MGQQPATDTQAGWSGGLNVTSDPSLLRPDQARSMVEFRLSNYGAALKRLGTALTTSAAITTFATTANVSGGIYWPSKDKIYIMAAATNSTAIHLYSTSYSFPNVSAWTDVGAFPQWRPVIFTDGVSNEVMYAAGDNGTAIQKFDGTTISALTTASATVDGLCVYNDRLWGWKGNSIYYSDLSSTVGGTGGDSIGNAAAGGGQIIVRTFGASKIKRCASVNGSLVIFHETGISALTGWGQSDIEVQPQVLNATIGMGGANGDALIVANEASTGDIAYFATPVGIYATNGGYVRPLGTPDKPDPVAHYLSTQPGGIAINALTLAFSKRYNELWVAAAGDGVYVYNIILGAWSGPFQGTYSADLGNFSQTFFNVINSGNQSPAMWRLVVNGPFAGAWVMECDCYGGFASPPYQDNVIPNGAGSYTSGTTVTGSLQLHRMFCGDRRWSKSYRWINLTATLSPGQLVSVQCTTPVNGAGSTVFLSNLTTTETVYYVSPGGTGSYIDVVITDSSTAGPMSYGTVVVDGFMLGQR